MILLLKANWSRDMESALGCGDKNLWVSLLNGAGKLKPFSDERVIFMMYGDEP